MIRAYQDTMANRINGQPKMNNWFFDAKCVGIPPVIHLIYFLIILFILRYMHQEFGQDPIFFASIMQISAAFLVILAFIYCKQKFLNMSGVIDVCFSKNKPDPLQKFYMDISFFDGDKRMLYPAFFMGLTAIFIMNLAFEDNVNVSWGDQEVLFGMITFLCATWAGVGIYAVYLGCRAIRALAQFDIDISPHQFSITYIGDTLSKCFMVIGFIWATFSASLYVGSDSGRNLADSDYFPAFSLPLATFFILLICFFYAVYPLHKTIISKKKYELRLLDEQIRLIQARGWNKIADDEAARISFLQQQQAYIASLPSWPFKKISIYNIGFSALLSFLPQGFETVVVLWSNIEKSFDIAITKSAFHALVFYQFA